MIRLDHWQEIFSTIRTNKLRTFLTGFSVAWGIFMLVVLLGAGNGIENGVQDEFKDDAINSIWIYRGQTSLPYKGLKAGRDIALTNEEFSLLQQKVEGLEHMTSRFSIRARTILSYKNKRSYYDVRSVHPDHKYLEKTIIVKGRFLHDLDLEEFRKVVVIGEQVKSNLFEEEEAIGKYIKINTIPFKVIGVFHDEGSIGENRKVYIPITTAQKVFNGGNDVSQIMVTTGDATALESQEIEANIRKTLASKLSFAPEDTRALYVRNNNLNFARFADLFANIRFFLYIIGGGTILAGIVGVSNIMFIVVKERTREIGIRKAIGATPGSIISMILLEAVVVTSFSGYIGLFLGLVTLESAANNLSDVELFRHPEIDMTVAIGATIVLIVAGILAGFIPARKAAAIQPIIALRDE